MRRMIGVIAVVLMVAGCGRNAGEAPVTRGAVGEVAATAAAATTGASGGVAEKRVAAQVSGGRETEGRDRGRPDVLVAAGLGVPTEVFREAFSHVRPAPAGEQPDPAQVQANKRALMDALGKYGVTNERLDEVSNWYRYPPGDRNLWKHVDAVIEATVVDGKVTGFVVKDGGAGYTVPPRITVPGYPGVEGKATLWFGKDLKKNGSVEKVEVAGG